MCSSDLATSILEKRLELLPGDFISVMPATKPVVTLNVDPESPQTQMKRPKRIRWVKPEYLRWVKTQPCECCGMPSDDPHHLIGHGQGGMGTKAHDSFTLPLCRKHHTELHNDPASCSHLLQAEIGRASCRERVCQYV